MYRIIKRLFDALGALLLLAFCSPLLLWVAMRIWLYDRGQILYRARRVGLGGKSFIMYKFRTMVLNADKIGGSSTGADDPRITPIGHILRRYKLDELPQLLNVLNGTMSFVGPRPQIQWAVDLYNADEKRVLDVPPGISDYASIFFSNEGEILKGSRDPDKDYMDKIHPTKMRLSLLYISERSLFTDLKVLSWTALTVFGWRPQSLTALHRENIQNIN